MCIFKIYLFILLEANYFTILWCFLPYINMNQPWVYMGTPHPEPPSHFPTYPIPLGCPRALTLSALLHASNLRWSSIFTFGSIHVSMLFSQIVPSSPSPTYSKCLFFTSVFLLLSWIEGCHYHLSKFHIYAVIYCIGISLSNLLHSV